MEKKVRKKHIRKKTNEFKVRFDLVSKTDIPDKQIYINCTYNGIRFRYYSGYRTPKENFERDRLHLASGVQYVFRVRKNTFNKEGIPATEINRRLDKLKLAALKVFDEHFKGKEEFFDKDNFVKLLAIELGEYKEPEPEKVNEKTKSKAISRVDIIRYMNGEKPTLDEEIIDENSIFFWYNKYIRETPVSKNRKLHYKGDMKKLKEYKDTLNYPLNFNNIDLMHYYTYLDDGSRKINTLISIMKRLKAFFNYCLDEFKIIDRNPFTGIKFTDKFGEEQYNEPVCMTREELNILYYKEMKKPLHELVRDMFCLQASLGCRISDFQKISYDSIANDIVSFHPQKTRRKRLEKITVPLSPRAKDIIKKYKSKRVRSKYEDKYPHLVIPFLDVHDYNELLKEVFRIAGLKRKVVLYNREDDIEEVFQLWELATSHLARRTFIDILFQSGESIPVIASMSGHTENSEAMLRYRREPIGLKKKAVSVSMD